ncbi:adenosylcobinamide-GDP ribazoletransferase [Dehalobacter sp. DCM]|uniref:adenosylcobinamide-GDP ribazoletransferase n=1 Tax=Dehalobacter sp. DCM TaxID=2907827 RepID=UPI00308197CB|nr:adenosylcobinamide-GDP ribazoletransferase [Dehalobacter sp. DCM]
MLKTLFESFVAAFSMYSKLPMPQISWNDKNMRYSFVFFPFVGIVIALILAALLAVCNYYYFSPALFSAFAVLMTVLITGGIHLDGYCDTIDALNSHKDREEKLRILKDPNVGAFALIYTAALLLVQFAAWYEIFLTQHLLFIVFISFFLSRSIGAMVVVAFPCARTTGLASIFADYASKKALRIILAVFILFCACAMVYINVIAAIFALLFVMISFLWFYRMMKREFGGITGDLAGFYIVICETGILTIAAVLGGILP